MRFRRTKPTIIWYDEKNPAPQLRMPGPPELLPDGRLQLSDEPYDVSGFEVLLPVVNALIERGNAFADQAKPEFWERYGKNGGFMLGRDEATAYLRDPITPADFTWLETRFAFPSTITYQVTGLIYDARHSARVVGNCGDGVGGRRF